MTAQHVLVGPHQAKPNRESHNIPTPTQYTRHPYACQGKLHAPGLRAHPRRGRASPKPAACLGGRASTLKPDLSLLPFPLALTSHPLAPTIV